MATQERAPTGELESRWVAVDGLRYHVRTAVHPTYNGLPIVLVHGLVISSLYMVPTARRLAPFYTVYAPDLPGFGLTDKPPHALTVPELADSLAAWMHAARLPAAFLVGNSLGCQIAADLAVRYPALARALVLAGPTMDARHRNAPQQVSRWLLDWLLERPSLAAAHARDYYEAGIPRALATFRYALEDRIEDKLPHIQAPTLIVRGSRDAIVPRRWCRELVRLLPDGGFAEIRGAPHVVNYTTPVPFVRVIRRFLHEVAR